MSVEFTARGSGYYRVFVDGVQVSQHVTERKMWESATNAKLANPDAVVTFDRDYEGDVIIVGAGRGGGSSPPDGGGSTLTHGESFTLTGSSFGTRSITREIWDDCSGATIGDVWDIVNGYDYRTPAAAGRSVALPHSNVSKYICGKPGDSGWYSNLWVALSTTYTKPSKLYIAAYRRYDPNWAFGTDIDDNTKYLAVSVGSVFESPYWYHDQTDQKTSLGGSWDNSFYSSGSLGSLNTHYTGTQGGSGDTANDMWYNWVKVEYLLGLDSSGQIVKYNANNTSYINVSSQNTDDSASGAARSFAIGSYTRDASETNNWTFLNDVIISVGNDAFKRVVLANNSTYASATITEYQPITSWSNTSIQFTANKGAISGGTAWLHVFDDSNTVIDTQEVTVS